MAASAAAWSAWVAGQIRYCAWGEGGTPQLWASRPPGCLAVAKAWHAQRSQLPLPINSPSSPPWRLLPPSPHPHLVALPERRLLAKGPLARLVGLRAQLGEEGLHLLKRRAGGGQAARGVGLRGVQAAQRDACARGSSAGGERGWGARHVGKPASKRSRGKRCAASCTHTQAGQPASPPAKRKPKPSPPAALTDGVAEAVGNKGALLGVGRLGDLVLAPRLLLGGLRQRRHRGGRGAVGPSARGRARLRPQPVHPGPGPRSLSSPHAAAVACKRGLQKNGATLFPPTLTPSTIVSAQVSGACPSGRRASHAVLAAASFSTTGFRSLFSGRLSSSLR